jgi:hypothetical protein
MGLSHIGNIGITQLASVRWRYPGRLWGFWGAAGIDCGSADFSLDGRSAAPGIDSGSIAPGIDSGWADPDIDSRAKSIISIDETTS